MSPDETTHGDFTADMMTTLPMYPDGSVRRPSEQRRLEIDEHFDRIRHPLGHAEPGKGLKEGTPGGPLR